MIEMLKSKNYQSRLVTHNNSPAKKERRHPDLNRGIGVLQTRILSPTVIVHNRCIVNNPYVRVFSFSLLILMVIKMIMILFMFRFRA